MPWMAAYREGAAPLGQNCLFQPRLPVTSGPARQAPGPGSGMAPWGTKPHQNPEATCRRCVSCRGHAAVTNQLATAGPLETGQDPPCCENTEPLGDTAMHAAAFLLKRSGAHDHEDWHMRAASSSNLSQRLETTRRPPMGRPPMRTGAFKTQI